MNVKPIPSPADFPIAETEPIRTSRWKNMSRMWVITLACAVLAIGLTWLSIDKPGPEIVIRFPEGHGLKEGDALRHRGIDVGRVAKVELGAQLSDVIVRVELDQAAAAIACEGSRFWIVRPKIDLTGVSGLETAVGSKYIAVIPGDAANAQREFEGLARSPPESLGENGIEIVLRGDDRHGAFPGTPVTWRGVEVGEVISSQLSADALHVDTRVRIMEMHRRLIARNSKFWVTSGVRMDFGMAGLKINTGTLDTIARGGIAFITPDVADQNEPVQSGDMFTLHPEGNEDWVESAPALNLLKREPPPLGFIVASWQQKHFGITRNHQAKSIAIPLGGDMRPTGGNVALLPKSMLTIPEGAIGESYRSVYQLGDGSEVSVKEIELDGKPSASMGIVALDPDSPPPRHNDRKRLRVPEAAEDCYLVRRTWREGTAGAVVVETIGRHEIVAEGEIWRTSVTRLDPDTWQGAAVLSASDERIIGVLIVDDEGAQIAIITPAMAG